MTLHGQNVLWLEGREYVTEKNFKKAIHRAWQFMTWPPFLHECLSSAWPRWPRKVSPAADPAKYNLHPIVRNGLYSDTSEV